MLGAKLTKNTHIFRLVVLAGVVAYVVGGLAGWFSGSDGFNDALIHPHELAGGEWVWLLLMPLLLAAIAPFKVRWLSFLWLAPIPALLFAGGSMVYRDDIMPPFPYFFLKIEEQHWGLVLSLVGAALATLALAAALFVVIVDREKATALQLRKRLACMDPPRRRLTYIGALIAIGALVGLGITLAYDPKAERIEDRLTKLVREFPLKEEQVGSLTDLDVRTHCERSDSRRWWCAYEIASDTTSSSSRFTTDGSPSDLKSIISTKGPPASGQ